MKDFVDTLVVNAALKVLKENGSISEDVILLFDEMWRLPKEYLNSHNCSFDNNKIIIPIIWSLHVGAEAAALG